MKKTGLFHYVLHCTQIGDNKVSLILISHLSSRLKSDIIGLKSVNDLTFLHTTASDNALTPHTSSPPWELSLGNVISCFFEQTLSEQMAIYSKMSGCWDPRLNQWKEETRIFIKVVYEMCSRDIGLSSKMFEKKPSSPQQDPENTLINFKAVSRFCRTTSNSCHGRGEPAAPAPSSFFYPFQLNHEHTEEHTDAFRSFQTSDSAGSSGASHKQGSSESQTSPSPLNSWNHSTWP